MKLLTAIFAKLLNSVIFLKDFMFMDPWSSQQYFNYARLRAEFGIETFDFKLPHAQKLFRRNIVFGHRGFETVYNAILKNKRFVVLTGLMPSGKMHFGHKMTIDQVIFYQTLGADVFIAVADLEAYATRNVSFEESLKIAKKEYILNYIALGLKPERTQIYFQSRRKAVTDLAFIFAKRTNLNELKNIYGFKDETSIAHVESPLIQAGDILHVQLEKYGNTAPTVVPVGIDQDPHIRLTRELARKTNYFSVQQTDRGMAIFVKIDHNVKALLQKIQARVSRQGVTKLQLNIPYKALYINELKTLSIFDIEEMLLAIEKEEGGFAFYPPAATYHRLMTSLTGTNKMSSSVPESYIALNEQEEMVKKKIKNAKTGGGASIAEHRKYGGNPDICTVYEYYLYHIAEDDKYLKEVYDTCRAGTRLCGNCKNELIEKITVFLKKLKTKRKDAESMVDKYIKLE